MLAPSGVLGAGSSSLPAVASADSSRSVVLLQLGCEVVLAPKLGPATRVVSTHTGVLGNSELAAEEGRVPESVEDCGEGEVTEDEEIVNVSSTEDDSVTDRPADAILKEVDVLECVTL